MHSRFGAVYLHLLTYLLTKFINCCSVVVNTAQRERFQRAFKNINTKLLRISKIVRQMVQKQRIIRSFAGPKINSRIAFRCRLQPYMQSSMSHRGLLLQPTFIFPGRSDDTSC